MYREKAHNSGAENAEQYVFLAEEEIREDREGGAGWNEVQRKPKLRKQSWNGVVAHRSHNKLDFTSNL